MRIDKISYSPQQNITKKQPLTQPQHNIQQNSYAYNPIAYKDYNINFNGRLFRTPANFYEQSFNRDGMPDTMKNYLFEDYEDRQNMPPQQMLKTVFDDLHLAKRLSDVQILYPNEPLFNDLKGNPSSKIRTGIVSQIELLKDENKDIPLFKDGTSDFGLYALKKIYLEGKSLKEINKSFRKDIQPIYSDIIDEDIDYKDLKAYGIKFPKIGFWHSFIVTRDDFNYTYKPRKQSTRATDKIPQPSSYSIEDLKNGKLPPQQNKPKPPKYKVSDREINGFTDAIMTNGGNIHAVNKHLKNKGFKDNENVTFIQKYFSEIMTVALDKINASDEMRMSFQNMETKKQVEKMNNYWKSHPEMKALQSIAMKDTIHLFFMAYGADGENEEFKDLIEYANSIAPSRAKKQLEHDRLQHEYDEMFAQIEETPTQTTSEQVTKKEIDPLELLDKTVNEMDAEKYKISIGDNKVVLVGNLDEGYKNALNEILGLFPSGLKNEYIKFLTSKNLPINYKMSKILESKLGTIPASVFTMDEKTTKTTTKELQKEFAAQLMANPKSRQNYRAFQQVFINVLPSLYEKQIAQHNYLHVYSDPTNVFVLQDIFTALTEDDRKTFAAKTKPLIDFIYKGYQQPLTSKEISQISHKMFDLIKHNELRLGNYETEEYSEASSLALLLGHYLTTECPQQNIVKKELIKYLESYGGSSRYLLDNHISDDIKMAKVEDILAMFIIENPKPAEKILFSDPLMYNFIKTGAENYYNKHFNKN